MNFRSIKQWSELAEADLNLWHSEVYQAIQMCTEKTKSSVVSLKLLEAACPSEGPLCGVPYGLKDLFDLKGYVSHNSSTNPELLSHRAESDSFVASRLNVLGATCVAKTQMNEFAYGLSGENVHYGDCPHPFLKGRLSGGSSSGSAHMVAAGYIPLAIGTDTGGSIRVPAAWCGLYGIRWVPSYGLEGGFPLAESFDTLGWFCRTAEDLEKSLRAWFEADDKLYSNDSLTGSYLLPELLIDTEVRECSLEFLYKLGINEHPDGEELIDVMPCCNQAFNVLQSSEAYELHRDWIESYGDLYDPAVKGRILRGARWRAIDRRNAEGVRDRIQKWFDAYFINNDFLVLPVVPRPAVSVKETTDELREKILRLTGPASLAGKPALTVPLRLKGYDSVGLQFIFKEPKPEIPLKLLALCKNI